MNLKELIAAFKAEWAKGEQASKETLDDLISDMEPIAARDYKQIKKLEQRAEGKSPEDVAALEIKIEDLTDQLARVTKDSEKTAKKLAAERDEALTLAQSEQKATSKLLIENGLTEELVKAGVPKERLKAARLLIESEGILNIKTEGDIRRAVAKVVKEGKEVELSLSDFVTKEWIGRDEAKALIPDGNSGAGASPGRDGGTTRQMAIDAYNAMKPQEQADFMKSGGQIV